MNKTKSTNSDQERDRQLEKSRKYAMFVGAGFMAVGVIGLVMTTTNHHLPSGLSLVQNLVSLILLIAILIRGHRYIKYNLKPSDEYEVRVEASQKAKAFNMLSTGLFLSTLLFPENVSIPVLYILLGYSWIIAERQPVERTNP